MKSRLRLLILGFLIAVLSNTVLCETANPEAQARFEQGLQFLKADKTDQALEAFKQAIELDENYVAAHRRFQELMLKQDKEEALIAEYRRRVERNPQSPVFYYLLGRLLSGKESEQVLGKSVELDPNFFWGHLALAAHYYPVDVDKGDAELKSARALCPRSGAAHAYLALTLYRVGKFDEAVAEFERARTLRIEDHVLSDRVGQLLQGVPGIRTFNLISFFAYLFAALICTAFLVRALKRRLSGWSYCKTDAVWPFFYFYCCLWFYVLFSLVARGDNAHGQSFNYGVLRLLVFFLDAFWPALVYHLFYRERSAEIRLPRFYKGMLVYFYCAGIVSAAIFLYAFIVFRSYRFDLAERLLDRVFILFLADFILCGLFSFTATMRADKALRAAREDPGVKSSRRWDAFLWAVWLFILWPLVIGLTFGVISIRDYGKYIQLLGTLMPLPFIIVGAYYQARYMLLDIFIKKADVVLVTGLVTALYYVFVVEPLARYPIWKNITHPALLILLPLVIAIPFLAQGAEHLIDRYFFKRRVAPAQALSTFSHAIRFISEEERLLEVLRNYLIDIFSTKHVMVIFSENLDESNCPIPRLKEEFATAKRPLLLNEIHCQETADFCKQNAFEVVVPLLVEEKISGCMALGKRYYKEPYLSEDLNLLTSIADQVEFALENIRLERARRAQELKEQELKVLASKAELRALRAQINPHFLFNTLNTIASLIRKNPQKAEETVEMLAEIFRYTLARSGTDFIPLAEELHFINAYLEVQKVRFGNKLLVEVNVDAQVEDVKVPSMLLQPLVENAIKHGISSRLAGGKITIGARRENGVLKLEVADNGVGFDSSTSQRLYKDGVGVKNVRDRLQAIYGNEAGFQIHSVPDQGTTVYIAIPWESGRS